MRKGRDIKIIPPNKNKKLLKVVSNGWFGVLRGIPDIDEKSREMDEDLRIRLYCNSDKCGSNITRLPTMIIVSKPRLLYGKEEGVVTTLRCTECGEEKEINIIIREKKK